MQSFHPSFENPWGLCPSKPRDSSSSPVFLGDVLLQEMCKWLLKSDRLRIMTHSGLLVDGCSSSSSTSHIPPPTPSWCSPAEVWVSCTDGAEVRVLAGTVSRSCGSALHLLQVMEIPKMGDWWGVVNGTCSAGLGQPHRGGIQEHWCPPKGWVGQGACLGCRFLWGKMSVSGMGP